MFLWRLIRPSRSNTQKRCPFNYRGLECKSRKSRNICSNRQIWPWSTEWSREKANRVLPGEHTNHSKHTLPTTQERTLTWTKPDGQHRNQIDYILCSQRWRGFIQSAKTRPGADCGSDHELLIAKKAKSLSCVWLFATSWTAAYKNSLSMGFSRQEYWSGLPFPSPALLPNSDLNWRT